MSEPLAERQEQWWITTGFLDEGGTKVMGPYESRFQAMDARNAWEKVYPHSAYCVDSEPAPGVLEGEPLADASTLRVEGLSEADRDGLAALIEPEPPKIERPPRGRYAVVEDSEGQEWVAIDAAPDGYSWQLLGQPHAESRYAPWGEIDAVRVLSPGAVGETGIEQLRRLIAESRKP